MLLWILFSSIYFVASTTHECNVAQLEFCYFQYFERFALPWFPDYPTFLNRTIEIRRFEGWPGQEKICIWQNELIHCLGRSDYSCINTESFELFFKLPKNDARKLQTDFYVREYECNKGYRNLHNSFYCFLTVWLTHRDLVDECNGYMEKSFDDEGNCDCAAAGTAVNCSVTLFSNFCGSAIRSFICNTEEIEVKSNSIKCNEALPKC